MEIFYIYARPHGSEQFVYNKCKIIVVNLKRCLQAFSMFGHLCWTVGYSNSMRSGNIALKSIIASSAAREKQWVNHVPFGSKFEPPKLIVWHCVDWPLSSATLHEVVSSGFCIYWWTGGLGHSNQKGKEFRSSEGKLGDCGEPQQSCYLLAIEVGPPTRCKISYDRRSL